MASSTRIKQIFTIFIAALFVVGFFYSPIGMWTGPILGLWLVGTQRPRAGFVWLLSFSFIPDLLSDKSPLWHSTGAQIPLIILWIFVASLIGILPLMFHRLISPRLKGLLSTLPYPLAMVLIQPLVYFTFPNGGLEFLSTQFGDKFRILSLAQYNDQEPIIIFLAFVLLFLSSWISACVIWFWNHPSDIANHLGIVRVFTASLLSFITLNFLHFPFIAWIAEHTIYYLHAFAACIILLTLYALIRPANHTTSWASKADAIELLESPATHEPLHFQRDRRSELLVSASGERFPILKGIPQFVDAEALSGQNKKYNHLYQAIGGFYDDTQRVWCALKGIDQYAYLRSYLGKLELKAGDRVLETSVGTGLNWKFLPEAKRLKLFGLDLSAEMLSRCQENLRRWNLEADLALGNAEELPYAGESFDCVFHVGGINFFNDRAKAIAEMIRVAKPGTLLLIADETEEHVQAVYENAPYTGSYFKKRKEPVLPPIDLVPKEMEDVQLDTSLMKGHFYVLTFRKPRV